jgi:hypothetical protein
MGKHKLYLSIKNGHKIFYKKNNVNNNKNRISFIKINKIQLSKKFMQKRKWHKCKLIGLKEEIRLVWLKFMK